MGKVVTRIRLTNHTDLDNLEAGRIPAAAVRSVELDALVDTGATELAIPREAAVRLGLRHAGTRRARLADGTLAQFERVSGIVLEILGRDTTCDALVLPEGAIALLGQVPLESLDLVVDPRSREVSVNPASPDVPLVDLMAV